MAIVHGVFTICLSLLNGSPHETQSTPFSTLKHLAAALALLAATGGNAYSLVSIQPGDTAFYPLMPKSVVNQSFNFSFNVRSAQRVFIDPLVAVGYDFVLTSGPLFQSVLLPPVGDNSFDLAL